MSLFDDVDGPSIMKVWRTDERRHSGVAIWAGHT